MARILELRCFGSEHAWLRVFKMHFISEQDPKVASLLRKQPPSLGELSKDQLDRELIATNEMAVINVSLIKGRASVTHVRPEKGVDVPETGYWWTHSFDVGTNDFN